MTLFPVTGVLLAGGQSSRMGFPKGKIIFRGITLAERALKVLSATCSEVLVSSSTEAYTFLKARFIADVFKNAGPLGGIHAALKNAAFRLVIFLPIDLPFIEETHIRFLIEKGLNADRPVVPTHADGKAEPLCGLYPANLAVEAENLILQKKYKVTDLLDKVGYFSLKAEDFPGYHSHLFFNVNTYDDLALLNNL